MVSTYDRLDMQSSMELGYKCGNSLGVILPLPCILLERMVSTYDKLDMESSMEVG